eukprot:411827_1
MSRFATKDCNHLKCRCKGFTPSKWNPNKCSSCCHSKGNHKSAQNQNKMPTTSQKNQYVSKRIPTKPHVPTMKNKHCKGHVNCQCEGFAPNKWTPNKCASCFHWKTHHTAGLQSQIPTVDAEPISVTSMKKNIDSQNKARPDIRRNNLSVAAMKYNFETAANDHHQPVIVVNRGTRSVSVSI